MPLAAQGSGSVQYFYDDAGRLIKVIDQNGNVAAYNYDAVGNLLSISRSTVAATGLSVFNFNPQSGPVGKTVTIQGSGFSATPASNSVRFNGTAAVVTAATATSLTVTVPAGATTGPISVTTGGQSATSSLSFTVTASTLVSIAISPPGTLVFVGQPVQEQFAATGSYADGSQQDLTTAVTWSSSNAAAATVSNSAGSNGLVTNVGAGITVLSATLGSVVGSTTVTVASPCSLFLNLNGSIFTMTKGSSLQFTASESFTTVPTAGQCNLTRDVTTQSTWSSSDTTLATVSNSPGSQGVVNAIGVGIPSICAVFSPANLRNCTPITIIPSLVSLAITPANQTLPKATQQQFTATGSYNDGSTQNLTSTVSWTSSNSAVATISNISGRQGLATETGAGTTIITATLGAISNSTTLTLTAALPSSLAVGPARVLIQEGNAYQFKATVTNTDGTTQDVTLTASWSTSDSTVASVNSQGFVTTTGLGSATISATSGSLTSSGTAIVTNPAAAVLPRFVYENNGDSTISIYSMNTSTGQLRSLGYAQGAGESLALALDPASQFLYVANAYSSTAPNSVSAYTVAANGSLTTVAGSPFATGTYPNAVATDSSGRFVFVVNGNDDTVSAFSIGVSGGLTPTSGSPFAVGRGPLAVEVDPSGQFLYVLNSTDTTISAFTINPNSGALSPVAGSPFAAGTNPQAMIVDPSGKFVLVGNPGHSASSDASPPRNLPGSGSKGSVLLAALEPFSLNGFGLTERVPSHAIKTLNNGDAVPLMLTAKGALATTPKIESAMRVGAPQSATPSTISVFSINSSSGALTQVSNSPFVVSGTPDSIAVDPTDRFVYVTYDSSVIDGFALDAASGNLTELSDAPYAVSEFSVSVVAVDPSGQFVYATGSADVLALSLNPSTGSLTSLGKIPARLGQFEIAISKGAAGVTYIPEFAYVASSGAPIGGGKSGANDISGYAISSSTGALTALSGSPFAEGLFPESLTADLLGQSLYVANNCDSGCTGAGSISAYAIDPVAGSLTVAGGAPFLAGLNPVQAVVDPSRQFVYVVNSGDNTISGYTVNPENLTLTPVIGSPVAVTSYGTGLNAIAMDPSGLSLYVTVTCLGSSCAGGGILEFNLHANGSLQFFQSFPVSSPQSITLDPAGGIVFVPSNTSNSVSAFLTQREFAFAAGSYLTAVTGSPFPTGQQGSVACAVDPTGKFLYVANQISNNISGYSVDPVAGTLTPIPGSPFLAGASPGSVTVDISGSYIYVVNSGDNTVSAYSVNVTSGALTPVTGSPFAADTAPISVVTTGKVQ